MATNVRSMMKSQVFSALFAVLLFIGGVFSETEQPNVQVHSEVTDPAEKLFHRLYKQRRLEQLEAVKNLAAIEGYEKQYKMVLLVSDKVFNVIQSSRAVLESSGYIPGSSLFPQEETVLDALANILENTALFGDIVLRLPDVAHEVLLSRHEWDVLLRWCLGFSTQTRLLDPATTRLVGLVGQELGITARQPGYHNPYARDKKAKRGAVVGEVEEKKKKEKKRREVKRGPKITARTDL